MRIHNPKLVVISMGDGKCYHQPKYIPSKYSYSGERLSTVCGRDSAIYDIHQFEINRVSDTHRPCKICYPEYYKSIGG